MDSRLHKAMGRRHTLNAQVPVLTAIMTSAQISLKKFYIVGFPVLKSKSPLLHNTAFKYHNLPHHYSICNTQDLNDLLKLMQEPDFGGASITMPHKLAIIDHVDELSTSAQILGAVNTLIPTTNAEGNAIVVGENTDWLGIRDLLARQLRKKGLTVGSGDVGLVLGAGGAARSAGEKGKPPQFADTDAVHSLRPTQTWL